MASVFTNIGALAGDPAIAATSMRVAKAGQAGARRRARVDTGAMRNGIQALPLGRGGARVISTVPHSVFNEYGTRYMSAQPFVRPSVNDARAAL